MKALKCRIKSLHDNKVLNCMIGLYNPSKYGKKEYLGYDTFRLKDCGRFLNVIEDRDYGAGGSICPLFFDGATSTFKELPPNTDKEALEKYYRYAEYLESRAEHENLELASPK